MILMDLVTTLVAPHTGHNIRKPGRLDRHQPTFRYLSHTSQKSSLLTPTRKEDTHCSYDNDRKRLVVGPEVKLPSDDEFTAAIARWGRFHDTASSFARNGVNGTRSGTGQLFVGRHL